MELKPVKQLRGSLMVPSDKSISHRGIMFGALANGSTIVHHFLNSADCLSTISCFQAMGIEIEKTQDVVTIHGKGLHGLKKPDHALDAGNSGTTTRLLSGILSGQDFTSIISGDASLQTRPMGRIMTPLSSMGAKLVSLHSGNCVPLEITGGQLHGITYHSPIASAQVKSAILLAGLYADGATTVIEPALSRNHTELMLSGFGAELSCQETSATIQPEPHLEGQSIFVPGDISSAAFFLCAAFITPNSELLIQNVGINPTRSGILAVCEKMGANLSYENKRLVSNEPVCDLFVQTSSLKGTVIEGCLIPTLIDELPVIAVMACFASGQTIIKDAADLKTKESNRIETMVLNLKAMGADIEATDDGMIINGTGHLKGAVVDSFNDHRIAMSLAIASLNATGTTTIRRSACVTISYPDFFEDLKRISCH